MSQRTLEEHIERNTYKRTQERSRTWCGTVWNEDDLDYIRSLKPEYLLIGHPEETTHKQLHWHCLLRFKNQRVRPKTVNAHWEKCINGIKFKEYATKKGEPVLELGEFNANPANEDEWRSFIELCKISTPIEMIEGPYSKTYAHNRGFAGEVHNLYRKLEILNGELINEWWWGAAGTGKSRKAFEEYPDAYIKSLNKWWDGYNDQEVVIIDDWGPNQECLVDHLKHWADRYPFPAEIKGSSMKIRPKKIIVTSNYPIETCFQREEDQEAIKRRFYITRFHRKLGE